jgi:hypothetical protein
MWSCRAGYDRRLSFPGPSSNKVFERATLFNRQHEAVGRRVVIPPDHTLSGESRSLESLTGCAGCR